MTKLTLAMLEATIEQWCAASRKPEPPYYIALGERAWRTYWLVVKSTLPPEWGVEDFIRHLKQGEVTPIRPFPGTPFDVLWRGSRYLLVGPLP